MMKIFICPSCGWLVPVSRKKEFFCSRCNEFPMERCVLTFERFSQMDEKQRRDYAQSWLYIHEAKKR